MWAYVFDPSGVSGVKLTYWVVDGTREGDLLALGMSQTATDTYAATLERAELEASLDPPSYGASATLEYYVQAFDGVDNRSQSVTDTVTIEYCLY